MPVPPLRITAWTAGFAHCSRTIRWTSAGSSLLMADPTSVCPARARRSRTTRPPVSVSGVRVSEIVSTKQATDVGACARCSRGVASGPVMSVGHLHQDVFGLDPHPVAWHRFARHRHAGARPGGELPPVQRAHHDLALDRADAERARPVRALVADGDDLPAEGEEGDVAPARVAGAPRPGWRGPRSGSRASCSEMSRTDVENVRGRAAQAGSSARRCQYPFMWAPQPDVFTTTASAPARSKVAIVCRARATARAWSPPWACSAPQQP